MISLQERVLCLWIPAYKVHLEHHEEIVISDLFSLSEDELEMLKEDDIDPSDLDFDNSKVVTLHKQLKKNESPSILEEKVTIPTEEEYYDMEEDDSMKRRYCN
jgi:hypothetical protein